MRKLLFIVCAIAAFPATFLASAGAQSTPLTLILEDQDWRFHFGDDPSFASPAFNDSGWTTLAFAKMTCPPGVCWMRKRISLPAAGRSLQLLIIGSSGSSQVFLDGQPVGAAPSPELTWKFEQELVFPLRTAPHRAASSPSTEVEVAIRSVGARSALSNSSNGQAAALIGDPLGIATVVRAQQGWRVGYSIIPVVVNACLLGAGLLLILLYRQQKGHAEYLWLGLTLITQALSGGLVFAWGSGFVPNWMNIVVGDPCTFFCIAAQLQFVYTFAARRPGRGVRAYQVLLLVIPFFLEPLTEMGFVTASAFLWFEDGVILPGALMILVLLVLWYRRGNREAGLLIVPMFLANVSSLLFDFSYVAQRSINPGFKVPVLRLGLVTITDWSFSNVLFLGTISVILFQRFNRISRDQALIQADLESARSIQQVLIPEALPAIANLRIESVYHPAQQVGGDFFQIIPVSQGTVVAIGDVSGKGLPAAMNVALIVGTLRTLAEQTSSPAMILAGLNRRMLGRGAGFTTCLVLHILPSGHVTLANAGHLSPYLDGAELALDNGLPLGLTAEAVYTETWLRLEQAQMLTLLTDGVVEATNPHTKELFGFERTLRISGQKAQEIAATAQSFGQQDDIAVLTLEFLPNAS